MASNQEIKELVIKTRLDIAELLRDNRTMQSETQRATREMSKSIHESNAAIALLGENIGVSVPRHLRTFVSQLPGVATAMSAAFDSVAVLALIGVVVEAGKKIYEFVEKTEEAAKKNAEAWKEIRKPIIDVNDSLSLANARIEDSIAKLEHKPQNGLKSALEEASAQAQQLGDKIDEDIKKIADLSAKQKGSWLERFTTSDQSDDISRTIAFGAKKYQEINPGYEDTLRRNAEAGNWNAYHQTRQGQINALNAALGPQIETLGEYLRVHQDLAGKNNPDFEKARSGYDTFVGILSALSKQDELENNQQHQKKLETGEAALKEQLKGLEDALHNEQILHGKSIAYEYDYWKKYISTFKQGTDEWRSVNDKFIAARDELMKQYTSPGTLKKPIDNYFKAQVDPLFILNAIKDNDKLMEAQLRAKESQATLNAERALEVNQIDLATGAINRHEAALQTAAIHTEEYKERIAALTQYMAYLKTQEYQDDISAILGLKDPDIQAKETDVQKQLDEAYSKRGTQTIADQQAVQLSTVTGSVVESLGQLSTAFTDTATQMRNVVLQGINSINDEIVKGLTTRGHKFDFGNVGHQVFTGLTKDLLEQSEGRLMKLLGFGGHKKADGYHVWVDNISGETVAGKSGIGGGILGALNDSDWAGRLFGGRLFGSGGIFDGGGGGVLSNFGSIFGGLLKHLGGGFAAGGDVYGGVPITVGELGPETFVPSVPGHIFPHNPATGGSQIHIDARGATDPASVHAQVHQALAAYLPYIHHGSISAVQDYRKRGPASAR